jgi:hypothetical protein
LAHRSRGAGRKVTNDCVFESGFPFLPAPHLRHMHSDALGTGSKTQASKFFLISRSVKRDLAALARTPPAPTFARHPTAGCILGWLTCPENSHNLSHYHCVGTCTPRGGLFGTAQHGDLLWHGGAGCRHSKGSIFRPWIFLVSHTQDGHSARNQAQSGIQQWKFSESMVICTGTIHGLLFYFLVFLPVPFVIT